MARWLPVVAAAVVAVAGTHGAQQRQTLAPHELNNSDAPPPIVWDPPDLPDHPVAFDSAEERGLKLTILARGLQRFDPQQRAVFFRRQHVEQTVRSLPHVSDPLTELHQHRLATQISPVSGLTASAWPLRCTIVKIAGL